MFKLSEQEIVSKIKESKGVNEKEIIDKIEGKLRQLSGLISREGAAHIVANEYGVKLFEQTSGMLKIKNVLAGMRSVETAGKITNVFELREFDTGTRKGKVASFIMGDETGKIRVTMWNDKADEVLKLKPDDIVKIKNAYVRENRGQKELHMNDKSLLIINPDDVKVGEVAATQQRNWLRKKIGQLQEGDENIELLGTVVQAFYPNFFETCPECRKTAKGGECEQHGKVETMMNCVSNVMLDDGDQIRVSVYKKQLMRLFDLKEDDLEIIQNNPETFDSKKNEVIGKIVKIAGKTKKNNVTERIDFTAQLVFPDPNPEEEK